MSSKLLKPLILLNVRKLVKSNSALSYVATSALAGSLAATKFLADFTQLNL
jgi:hypothetical protein